MHSKLQIKKFCKEAARKHNKSHLCSYQHKTMKKITDQEVNLSYLHGTDREFSPCAKVIKLQINTYLMILLDMNPYVEIRNIENNESIVCKATTPGM